MAKEPKGPKEKDETPSKESFAQVIGKSGEYQVEAEPEKRVVEFVGRVYRAANDGTFTMALASDVRGVDRLIEANVADVVEHEVAFEDSSGRKTMKVRLPEDAEIRMVLKASQLLASPTTAAVSKQDVKPDPMQSPAPAPKPDPGQPKSDVIKQHDPIKNPDSIFPKHDPVKNPDPIHPKHDPIKQDPTPKHDPISPKHDPIKQIDPIKQHDPIKNFDPIKQHDPIKGFDPIKNDPFDPGPIFAQQAAAFAAPKQSDVKNFDQPIKNFDPKPFDPKNDPKLFDPKPDPKNFDPKQFDPINPKTHDPKFQDPKHDPKGFDPKQFDPKFADPKHSDPVNPKFQDPKLHDPKQFDPKQFDPKHNDPGKNFDPGNIKPDPIKGIDPGPIKGDPGNIKPDPIKGIDPGNPGNPKFDPGNPGPFQQGQSMMPFVLSTPFKQGN